MNFEESEKLARVAARARVRGSARGCGAPVRSLAAGDPGLPGQVERQEGSNRERPGWDRRRELRPRLAPGVPAMQLRWGFFSLLLNLPSPLCLHPALG